MLRRIALTISLLLLPALALAAPKGKARTGRPAPVEGIMAQVDSVALLRSEVLEQATIAAQSSNPPVNMNDPVAARQLKNDVLDRMVSERLVVLEAVRQGLQVTESDVTTQVEQAISTAHRRLGSEEAFRAQLQSEGLSEEGLRKRYAKDAREQLLGRKLLQREVQSKVSVDSADARAFYDKNKAKLPPRPQMLKLSVILIQIEASDSVKAHARQKADAVLTRAKAGEDFARLATLFSDDGTARTGGDLGWVSRGQLDSTFEHAAWALKSGELSGVVQTRYGYHVIRSDSTRGDQRKLRHILVLLVPDKADSTAALEKAAAIRLRAFNKEDFGKLAQQFSDDPASRLRNGELEPREANTFTDEIAAEVSRLVPTQVSGVIRSPSGFVIFKLLEIEQPRAWEFSEITERMLEAAQQDEMTRVYDSYIVALKKKHRVVTKRF